MSQTEFDVETMDAVKDIEAVDRAVMISPDLMTKTRSEASKRAWETRRKNKEAAFQRSVPVTAGITAEQARETKDMAQRLFEAREEFAEVGKKLEYLEAEWDIHIQSITAKEK
jgi:hypothetical protein